ncbi:MAG TPA: hypothetical protein VN607_12755 [Gemmatimonadaceae bacterium]|nr:hypothetical protein [Gemmatimonadaceae bacterium]
MTAPVLTNDTLDQWRAALSDPRSVAQLRKAGINVATGLTFFDLRAPAQTQYPVLTPLRNVIPRRPGRGGPAVNWKVTRAINTTSVPAGVAEGHRNAVISLSVLPFVRAYVGLGMENNATFEARYAGENFEDVDSLASLTALQSLMIAEEQLIIGGNNSLALGTTPTPTAVASTTGGTIPTATAVSVICVALTPDGLRRASLASGVVQTIARTSAAGEVDTVNGGTAQKSAAGATSATTTSTSSVGASVAPVVGAAGYAWFAGTAGAEKIAAITTINSVVITALPASGQTAASLTSTDNSQDALVFDGLMTFAADTSHNGGYYKQLATGTAGTGTTLTADGANGIKELNDLFSFYWDPFRLSPDVIYVNAQEMNTITNIVVANGGSPMLRLTMAANGGDGKISAGVQVSEVLNKITGKKVAVEVHPYVPAGTIISYIKNLPAGTYQGYNPGSTLEMDTRQEYYQLQWPLKTRQREFGVYVDEVLVPWASFAFGAISNIAHS